MGAKGNDVAVCSNCGMTIRRDAWHGHYAAMHAMLDAPAFQSVADPIERTLDTTREARIRRMLSDGHVATITRNDARALLAEIDYLRALLAPVLDAANVCGNCGRPGGGHYAGCTTERGNDDDADLTF